MRSNTSKNSKISPLVSILIPTLNSQNVLTDCLTSIRFQTFSDYEILLIDGGSTDRTLSIARSFKCKILPNLLKTAEAAKAIGLKHATGEYIALIDSDNILPDKNWFEQMLKPLEENSNIIGSEPWSYTYRKKSGFIERYSALTGVNDPYALTAGIYDRQGYLNPSWTGLKLKITDFKSYQVALLLPHTLLPTIGANGTIIRKDFLKKYFNGDYFFDVDIITQALNISRKPLLFSKVKTGIIHSFCESSVSKFFRKQNRRATDLYTFRRFRTYPLTQNSLKSNLKFIFYVVLVFPMLFDTLRGFIKKPDPAWFFHPLACLITLYAYGLKTFQSKTGILKPINRSYWRQ